MLDTNTTNPSGITDGTAAQQSAGTAALGTSASGYITRIDILTDASAPPYGTFNLAGSSSTVVAATFSPTLGGTGSKTYQLYGSTTSSAFTPGPSNLIAGQTSLAASWNPGVAPGSVVYLKMVSTDGAGATQTSPVVPCPLAFPAVNVGGVGDSYIAVYSTNLPAVWGTIVADRPLNFVNHGLSGFATADIVQMVQNPTATHGGTTWNAILADLAAQGCTAVMVHLGTNDAKVGNAASAAVFKANMVIIINALVAAGLTVVVNSPCLPGSGAPYNTGVPAIGTEQWDDTAAGLIASYQAACDQLCNGTTIRRGDNQAYRQFLMFPGYLQPNGVHPDGVAGSAPASGSPQTGATGTLAAINAIAYSWAVGLANALGYINSSPGGSAPTYTAAANVRSGTDRGDGTLGTLVVPAASSVLVGTSFDNGTAGLVTLPAIGKVRQGYTYGPSLGLTGTDVSPAQSTVETGTGYGAGGTEFTGSFAGSGGSGDPAAIAAAVVAAMATAPVGSVSNLSGVPLSDGTVTSAASSSLFSATGDLNPSPGGYSSAPMSVQWKTGANAGFRYAIGDHTVSGSVHSFTLANPTANPPAAGDTFVIV